MLTYMYMYMYAVELQVKTALTSIKHNSGSQLLVVETGV